MNIKNLKGNHKIIEKVLAGTGIVLAGTLVGVGIKNTIDRSDNWKTKSMMNPKQSTTQEDSTKNTWYTFGHTQKDGSKLLVQLTKDEVSNVYLDENGFPVIFNTSKVNEDTGEVENLLTGEDVDLTECSKQDSFFDYLASGDIHVSSTTLWDDGSEYIFEGDSVLADLADVFDYNITFEQTINDDGTITKTKTMEGPIILTTPVDGPIYDENGNVIEQSSSVKTRVK